MWGHISFDSMDKKTLKFAIFFNHWIIFLVGPTKKKLKYLFISFLFFFIFLNLIILLLLDQTFILYLFFDDNNLKI